MTRGRSILGNATCNVTICKVITRDQGSNMSEGIDKLYFLVAHLQCTGTDVVQHLHQRPARTRRHSQLHLRRQLVCIASQGNDFNNIEVSLTSALSTMTTYYDTNQLRANPSKTQVCAFHLRNREAKRELNVMWNGTRLSNTTTLVYLGVHIDRTMCYKTHIEKTKMKVNARNNIIRKLANSKWGCKASTLRPSCLALCYSAAEYACPVWARSAHAPKLNPALHDCCRIISGCLKPTNLDSVHLLAGIAPPHIRRTVACRMECTRQTTDDRHQLFHHQPAASRLKSRKSFTPPDRRAILCQNGTGGGRVFAGWIWRGLALLASH